MVPLFFFLNCISAQSLSPPTVPSSPRLYSQYSPSATLSPNPSLPITYGTTTPSFCSVSGGVVTFGPNVGLCTVTAIQLGDSNYAASAQTSGFASLVFFFFFFFIVKCVFSKLSLISVRYLHQSASRSDYYHEFSVFHPSWIFLRFDWIVTVDSHHMVVRNNWNLHRFWQYCDFSCCWQLSVVCRSGSLFQSYLLVILSFFFFFFFFFF